MTLSLKEARAEAKEAGYTNVSSYSASKLADILGEPVRNSQGVIREPSAPASAPSASTASAAQADTSAGASTSSDVVSIFDARSIASDAGIRNADNLSASELAKKLDISVQGSSGKVFEAPSIKRLEKTQADMLKDAQTAEIKFLKAEGASKQEVNAEKSANKTEFSDAKGLLKPVGLQYIPQRNADTGFITSNVGTYQDTYAAAIQPKIEQALGLLSDYSIPQSTTRYTENATITTGMSLNNAYALAAAQASGKPVTAELLKEQYGNYVSGANRQAKIFNAVDNFANNPNLTAADFSKALKPVKGQEDIFTSKIGGGTTGVFQYDPATESYKYLSATPVKVTEEDGGFFSSPLGSLLIGIGGSLLVPGLGGFLATGTWGGLTGAGATLGSTLAAGGLIGAGTAALTGQNILTGLVTGGLSAGAMFGVGQAGGLGNVIKNAGVGISDDFARTLNTLVSGVGVPTTRNARLAADLLTRSGIPTTADDILTSVARESVETVVTPLARESVETIVTPLASEAAESGLTGGGVGFRLTPNQLAGLDEFIPPPSSVTRVAGTPGTMGGIGFNPNAGGIGFQVNPEDFLPTPRGAGTLPAPSNVNVNLDRYIPPPVGALAPPSLLDDFVRGAGNVADDVYQYIRENPLKSIGIGSTIIEAANQPQQPPIPRPPKLAEDINLNNPIAGTGNFPGMGGPIDWNAFMNLYRRGGLGAGQYLGYDLINRLGDIPLETLLGTPIFGGNVGQTSPGTTSLV